MRILWDDPEWNNGVRDGDAARAEQRAGKKYQETKESRQIAEDASVRSALEEKFAEKRWEAEENDRIADGLSTQAAIDEKLAGKKQIAIQPIKGYDENENAWDWFIDLAKERIQNDPLSLPYRNMYDSLSEKPRDYITPFMEWLADIPNHYSPHHDIWTSLEDTPNAYEANSFIWCVCRKCRDFCGGPCLGNMDMGVWNKYPEHAGRVERGYKVKKLSNLNYIYLVVVWTVFVALLLSAMPFFTVQYRGIGADSQERVYINEAASIGVYKEGKRIGKVSLSQAHITYGCAYQFLMQDDRIYVSESGLDTFDVLDLKGNWLGYGESRFLTAWEMNEHEMKNGDLLVLEDKPFLPAKAVRCKTDGSEETVFREPLLQYGLKLSIPAVWVLYFVWQIRESHRKKKEWEAQFAARQNPTEK